MDTRTIDIFFALDRNLIAKLTEAKFFESIAWKELFKKAEFKVTANAYYFYWKDLKVSEVSVHNHPIDYLTVTCDSLGNMESFAYMFLLKPTYEVITSGDFNKFKIELKPKIDIPTTFNYQDKKCRLAINQLIKHFGNQTKTAKALEVDRKTVRAWFIKGQVSIKGVNIITSKYPDVFTKEQLRPDLYVS